jgi:two-component system chemotaxis response regulator CheB
MQVRDIVVIGASAGGLEALLRVLKHLPADLPAALFVVLHVGSRGGAGLPDLFARKGALPAKHAVHGEKIEPGRIYVAPADRHLLLMDGHVHLNHGPKHNRTRPAIDPTFYSAALSYGSRVAAVILSGALDDGAAGAWWVRRHGGVVVVQDPAEALFPSMPSSARALAGADRVATAEQIAQILKLAARQGIASGPRSEESMERTSENIDATCPDCQGPISEVRVGSLRSFECMVGHAFSPKTFYDARSEMEENALWAAVAALEQGAVLARRLAESSPTPEDRSLLQDEAADKDRRAAVVRSVLATPTAPPTAAVEEEPDLTEPLKA